MNNGNKILLSILPYWDPMIPPNGIAHLKSFLQTHGFQVKTVDAVIEETFQNSYKDYFQQLKKTIPPTHWGNFYNLGHDVLQTHMMAHINYTDKEDYIDLVKLLVYHTYYYEIRREDILALIDIIDGFYSALQDYYVRLLEQEKPSVAGFTAYRATLPATIFVCRLIKKKYPAIRTIIGGGIFVDTCAVGTENFKLFLEHTEDCIDKMIIGQGELLFLKYLRGELPEAKRYYTRSDIDGEILAFAQVEPPDFSDFDLDRYNYLPATASSSCPHGCSFCSAKQYYGEFREKDVEQTAQEMLTMHKKYGHQLFFMTDSLLNTVITRLSNELTQAESSIYYDTYFRIDSEAAHIENTMLWRRGGAYRVRIGAESGSQHVLDLMGKNITPGQIKAAVSALAYAGIKTTTYWVMGHPGETEDDFQETLALVEEMKDDIYQAETNVFKYHSAVQTADDKWRNHVCRVFPAKYQHMLVFAYNTLDIPPLREEVYNRAYRFELHCKKLGIPNPYSLNDYVKADERWAGLHKNAVPPILDFLAKAAVIDENKKIERLTLARNTRTEKKDFVF
ncbi:MAG TPA: radical SAM protein [Candidatus Deferrimicrobium sp.]|nr:radical SAM protein [Candidatus Deferrimicrobium sp.]